MKQVIGFILALPFILLGIVSAIVLGISLFLVEGIMDTRITLYEKGN